MDRNVTPAQHFHAFLLCDHFEHALRESPAKCVLRQEEHTDAVIAFLGLRHLADPGFSGSLLEEFM